MNVLSLEFSARREHTVAALINPELCDFIYVVVHNSTWIDRRIILSHVNTTREVENFCPVVTSIHCLFNQIGVI